MTLPASAPDIQEVARAWKKKLAAVRKSCVSARDNIDANREHLISAYLNVHQLLAQSSAMALSGLTADVVGPALQQITPGLVWSDHADAWAELRDSYLPTLLSVVKLYESDVVRGAFSSAGDVAINYPLPENRKTEILAALNDVISRIA